MKIKSKIVNINKNINWTLWRVEKRSRRWNGLILRKKRRTYFCKDSRVPSEPKGWTSDPAFGPSSSRRGSWQEEGPDHTRTPPWHWPRHGTRRPSTHSWYTSWDFWNSRVEQHPPALQGQQPQQTSNQFWHQHTLRDKLLRIRLESMAEWNLRLYSVKSLVIVFFTFTMIRWNLSVLKNPHYWTLCCLVWCPCVLYENCVERILQRAIVV